MAQYVIPTEIVLPVQRGDGAEKPVQRWGVRFIGFTHLKTHTIYSMNKKREW